MSEEAVSLDVEDLILNGLVHSEEYLRQTLPYLDPEYFETNASKTVFALITEGMKEYNKCPTPEALGVMLKDVSGLSEDNYQTSEQVIRGLRDKADIDVEWLVDRTEKWCQDRAVYLGIMESIKILDGQTKKDKGSIPEILTEALSVSFDTSIGHSFLDDVASRFEFYHKLEEKVKFDLDFFNKITRGGVNKKTLNVIMAGTGVGKSLMLCHLAAAYMLQGVDVLYITMEMAEEKIAERIDANLLDVEIDQLAMLPKEAFFKKFDRLKMRTVGNLVIKEYPTGAAHTGHFRHLINELRMKKKFKPQVIMVDYLNICASARIKGGPGVGSYQYVKAIAEELRGLAVEFDVPLWSATQTNRTGFSSSDVGLEDTSESFGLPMTADFMFAVIETEELAQLNQFMVRQLKNRYSDLNRNRRFVIGVDKPKMRLYDTEQVSQEDIIDDGPVFDNSPASAGLPQVDFADFK